MSRKRLQKWKEEHDAAEMPQQPRVKAAPDAIAAGRALATAAESYLDAFDNDADYAAAARTLRSAITRFRNVADYS